MCIMKDEVLISREEYNNYLRLKKIEEDAKSQVYNSIKDLKEGKVYEI